MSWNKKSAPKPTQQKLPSVPSFSFAFHTGLYRLGTLISPSSLVECQVVTQRNLFSSSNSNLNTYICKKDKQIGPKKPKIQHRIIPILLKYKQIKQVNVSSWLEWLVGYTTSKGLGWGFPRVCFTESWVCQAPWERPAKGDRFCLPSFFIPSIINNSRTCS